MTTLFKVHMK